MSKGTKILICLVLVVALIAIPLASVYGSYQNGQGQNHNGQGQNQNGQGQNQPTPTPTPTSTPATTPSALV